MLNSCSIKFDAMALQFSMDHKTDLEPATQVAAHLFDTKPFSSNFSLRDSFPLWLWFSEVPFSFSSFVMNLLFICDFNLFEKMQWYPIKWYRLFCSFILKLKFQELCNLKWNKKISMGNQKEGSYTSIELNFWVNEWEKS